MHAKNSTPRVCPPTRLGPSIESRSLFGCVTRPSFFALLLLSVSCSRTPAPQVVSEPESRSAPPNQVDAGTPAADTHALPRGPLETEQPAAAGTIDGGSRSTPPVRRAPAFVAPVSWYCVQWTHFEMVPFSKDCYMTTEECQAARPEPDRQQVGSGCRSVGRAWCAKIYARTGARTRCFDSLKFCEKARSIAADDGLESSECTEVPAQK